MTPTFSYLSPRPALAGYVRQLQVIHLDFSAGPPPPKPYWPRPACCLAFYPRDLEWVAAPDAALRRKPRAIFIGQPTSLTHRSGGRDFCVFQVEFEPGALYRLTGLPLDELRDDFIDAEAVFPREIGSVVDRLSHARSLIEMIAVVEGLLLGWVERLKRPASVLDLAARRLILGGASLHALIGESGLSARQFRRQFTERAGVGAAAYGRIARLDRAIRMKNLRPGADWFGVALDCGYYDHQHMARDFRSLTGMTPTAFQALESDAPERHFGIVET